MFRIFELWLWGFFACIGGLILYSAFDILMGIPADVTNAVVETNTPTQNILLTVAHWGAGVSVAVLAGGMGLFLITMGRCQFFLYLTYIGLGGFGLVFATYGMLDSWRKGEFFMGILLFFIITGAGIFGAVFAYLAMEAIFKVGDNILR